jgi:hypothetical protein
MKRTAFPGRLRWVIPLLAIAALCGCPYSSAIPLSDPGGAELDPLLPGLWRMLDPETGEQATLSFLAFNDRELVACYADPETGRIGALALAGARVGPERFLSMRELGTDDPSWYLARYAVDGGRLTLRLVDDALFGGRAFASSAELRLFVAAHAADPRLYAADGQEASEMVLTRVTAADAAGGELE